MVEHAKSSNLSGCSSRGLRETRVRKPARRGQYTIIGVTMSVIALIMYVALLPVMEEMILIGINATNNTTIQLLLPFLPVVMLFGIIITTIMYTTASR